MGRRAGDRLVQAVFLEKRLQDLCEWPVSKRGGGAGRALVFTEAYPDTRAVGGLRPLRNAGWAGLYKHLGIESEDQFVSHLLSLHDGEVRFVGAPWWAEMGPRDRVYHCRYWHAQTMSHKATREWAYWNHGGGRDMFLNKDWPVLSGRAVAFSALPPGCECDGGGVCGGGGGGVSVVVVVVVVVVIVLVVVVV